MYFVAVILSQHIGNGKNGGETYCMSMVLVNSLHRDLLILDASVADYSWP